MKEQQITIFVHGTLPPDALMAIPPVRSFFYCPTGLTQAVEFDPKFHTYKLAQQLCSTRADEFDMAHFYLFGWSGKLNPLARKEASQELFQSLRLLAERYRQQGTKPQFRIITHSHGGNVALHMHESTKEHAHDLVIDELIVLACPVQTETAAHAHPASFKKIYSIHSHSDLLQVLDPQGVHAFLGTLKEHGLEFTMSHLNELGPLFSSRHFEAAEHIIQLNVRYPRRELFHIEFLLPKFISTLPSLLETMRNHEATQGSNEIVHVFNQ